MSGISPFPLKRKTGNLASMLPDKFTDADVKAVYNSMGNAAQGVAGIRDGWEEESLALQEEALRSAPEARLEQMESRLDRLEGSVASLRRSLEAQQSDRQHPVAQAEVGKSKGSWRDFVRRG